MITESSVRRTEAMLRVVVCVDCIGDRRLYATTATRPPVLGERCSRCGEEAKLGPEIRRVCIE